MRRRRARAATSRPAMRARRMPPPRSTTAPRGGAVRAGRAGRIRKSLTALVNPCRFVWDQTITSFAMFATTSVSHASGNSCWRSTSRPITTAANEIAIPATIWKRRDTIHPPIRSGVVRRRLRTLHAVVTRSKMIARSTMAIPASSAPRGRVAATHRARIARDPRAHDGGDHDDAERRHDRLVHTEHDRWLRERDLDESETLLRRRAERIRDLDGRRGHGADAERRQADRRWEREHEGGDQGSGAPTPKSRNAGSR